MSSKIGIAVLFATAGVAAAQPFSFIDEGSFSTSITDGAETLNIISGTTITPVGLNAIVPVGTNSLGTGITAKAAIVKNNGLSAGGTAAYNVTLDVATYYPAQGFFVPFTLAPEMMIDMGTTLPSGGTATTIAMSAGTGGDGFSFANVWGGNTSGLSIVSSSVTMYFAPNNAGAESTLVFNDVAFDNGDLSVGVAHEWTPGTDVSLEGFAGARWNFTVAVVPSPASAALLGMGGLVATRRRRG